MSDRLGIVFGDRVSFVHEEYSVRIDPVHVTASLLGIFTGLELALELEGDRRKEVVDDRLPGLVGGFYAGSKVLSQ